MELYSLTQNGFVKSDSLGQFSLSYVNENFLSSQSLLIHVEKEQYGSSHYFYTINETKPMLIYMIKN